MAIAAPNTPFVWGAGGSMKTPEQVAREREIAAALLEGSADTSPVGHWTQGAARLVSALGGVMRNRRADEAERAGQESFASDWARVLGGGAGATPAATQVASIDPSIVAAGTPQTAVDAATALASVPSGDRASYIRQGLVSRGLPEHVADAFLMNFQDESGLNPDINEAEPTVPGSRGGYGLYQLTGPRRRAYEAYAAQRGVPTSDIDAQLDFMMSELAGPEARAYQSIMGASDTGSAAAAIVNDFLRPAEQHRARREASYLGGGGSSSRSPSVQVAQALAPSMNDLIGLAGNPWANDTQRSIVNALIGQQMEQQAQANDPLRQLQIQAAQQGLERGAFELDALRNPAAPEPIEVGGVLLDPNTYQPLFDSRPPQDGGFTLSPGQGRFDAQGNPVASIPAEADMTSAMQNYQFLLSQGVDPETAMRQAFTSGTTVNVGGEAMTPGWKKIDETFAPEYIQWISGGGSDARAQIANLDNALGLLESGQAVTGDMRSALPRELQAFINTEGLIARENVEEVVQRSLRETLGAQFTEREGERLIQRAFNPLLPPGENIRRARLLAMKVSEMAAAKDGMADYFRQNGTLMGYTGESPSMNALLAVEQQFGADPEEVVAGGPPAQSQANPGVFSGPQPGTVEDGYRFKGGNPADPNNWERVQ